VAEDARTYIQRSGCQSRVDIHGFNLFQDPWPSGYDAILLSNVLHDWDSERRAQMVRCSFDALPPRGRLYVHEMLLNDAQDGPLAATLFSVMMLGTRGKQLSIAELDELLSHAGFGMIDVQQTYGYYSLVSAPNEA